MPDAGSIKGSKGLPSWSYDASISHAKPLAKNWLIRPYLGTAWVSTRHDALAVATPPFTMNMAGASMKQSFVDAGLGFETAPDAKSPWRSFLTLGARYRAYGKQSQATAALAGYSTSLVAEGVTRNQFVATVAAGMEYLLPAGVTLFLNTSGEFGKASDRGSLVGGVQSATASTASPEASKASRSANHGTSNCGSCRLTVATSS